MRIWFDATTLANIPPNPDGVFAYVDGKYRNYGEALVMFPHATVVSVAVDPAHDAQVLDCEKGDATPEQCPSWAVRQRVRGSVPYVYCSGSAWPAVKDAFDRHQVTQPEYGIAIYDGIREIPPGARYKQIGGVLGKYDINVVSDHMPGIDPDEDTMDDATITKLAKAIGGEVADQLLAALVPIPSGGSISYGSAVGATEHYTQTSDATLDQVLAVLKSS